MDFILTVMYIAGAIVWLFFITPIMMTIGIFIGIFYGFGRAFPDVILAISTNINVVDWSWENDKEPSKRSYFCGPGYRQLKHMIKDTILFIDVSISDIYELSKRFDGLSDGVILAGKVAARWFFSVSGQFMCILSGFLMCASFTILFGGLISCVSAVRFVWSSVTLLFDKMPTVFNRVSSDCPVCHERSALPAFACPSCYELHRSLRPGVFGIYHHRCNCKKKLPCTSFNGRSKLNAFCPVCESPLVVSGVHPVTFQLIGGSKAGKSVFLASFFHLYIEKLGFAADTNVTVPEKYEPYFDELDLWYNGKECPSTTYMNSQMYPILIDGSIGVTRQFSVYDVAGEIFLNSKNPSTEVQQRQFMYCEGFLFLLDPFSVGNLREEIINSSGDEVDCSEYDPDKVIINFVNYLISIGSLKPGTLCKTPIAVLIVKADVKIVKKEIDLDKLKAQYKKNEDKYREFSEFRNKMCREFLIKNGMNAVVDSIESNFANVSFFPVSAMGHSPNGSKYEPWGVLDGMEWLLSLADEELASLTFVPEQKKQASKK